MTGLLLSAVCLLLIGTACGAGSPLSSTLLDESYTFEQYEQDFAKSYKSANDRARRERIFEANKKLVLEHNNKNPAGHFLGINDMMDLEASELPTGYDKSFHGAWGNAVTFSDDRTWKNHQMDLPFEIQNVSQLPKSVNWRSRGVVTPVKSQGVCGSCWAMASTAVLESHIAIETGVLFTLSVQELVSCVQNPRHCGGNGNCSGATAYLAMDFVASNGILDEWQMGYTSYDWTVPKCGLNTTKLRGFGKSPVASIEGYAVLPTNNYTVLMNAVAKMGPLVVSVACTNWGLYKGGVYTETDTHSRAYDLNHAVVLDGYGTDQETGEDYWLVRNSWGPRWGENGYIRLKRVDPSTLDDPDTDCGMDVHPKFGDSCTKDEDGNPITPPAVKVCGTNGILFDPVLPIGGHLV